MKKLNMLFFAVVGVLFAAMPAFAQQVPHGAAEGHDVGLKAIAAGVGFAIAVVGGALGQSRIGASACEAPRVIRALLPRFDHDDSGSRADRVARAVCARDRIYQDLVAGFVFRRRVELSEFLPPLFYKSRQCVG